MEINQYDITIVTQFDITMGNDIARYAHCKITMCNNIAKDIHCDHGITMNNDIVMNLFY